ncbi:PAC2 family protein [Mesorhizobium temperatum]|uniref:PAC2 family protein n=1 Tax=Mesorhizobium temperatum TaxID=241416 RepID=UPI001FD8B2BB|nr:PAC2 family protein [Mesorhizobium temperatum]
MTTPQRLSGHHLSEDAVEAPETIQNAWAGLKLVRMAIEKTCPAGVLPSEEAVLLLYGPEPIHEGEALAKAIIETVERLNQ